MAEASSSPAFNWSTFLNSAGIHEPHDGKYAAMFVEQGIDESLLEDLNQEWLSNIGIESAGHQMRILRTIKQRNTRAKIPHSPSDVTLQKRSEVFSPYSGNRFASVTRRRGGTGLPSHMLTRSLLAVLPSWGVHDLKTTQSTRVAPRAPSELLFLGSDKPSSSNDTRRSSTSSGRGQVQAKKPVFRYGARPINFINYMNQLSEPLSPST
jgi:hypothetical protein